MRLPDGKWRDAVILLPDPGPPSDETLRVMRLAAKAAVDVFRYSKYGSPDMRLLPLGFVEGEYEGC